MISFFVPGHPIPKQSTRFANGHSYKPAKIRGYENHIRECAETHMSDKGLLPIEGDVCIIISFVRDNRIRVDVGNLEKPVCDALNDVCYIDDYQITDMLLHKHTSTGKDDPAGIYITVMHASENPYDFQNTHDGFCETVI